MMLRMRQKKKASSLLPLPIPVFSGLQTSVAPACRPKATRSRLGYSIGVLILPFWARFIEIGILTEKLA